MRKINTKNFKIKSEFIRDVHLADSILMEKQTQYFHEYFIVVRLKWEKRDDIRVVHVSDFHLTTPRIIAIVSDAVRGVAGKNWIAAMASSVSGCV